MATNPPYPSGNDEDLYDRSFDVIPQSHTPRSHRSFEIYRPITGVVTG